MVNKMLKNILKESKRKIPVPQYGLPPTKGPILVIAPHFDDDIIGCGGTLLKYFQQGVEIHVVYLTDGTGGAPSEVSSCDITNIRYQEAKESIYALGIHNAKLHCLNIKDGTVNDCVYNKQLEELILEIKPETVFTPYIIDIHHDHRGANNLLYNVLRNYSVEMTGIKDIIMYEVWTPLLPNLCVNISGEFEKKINALKKHVTQIKLMRYVEMVSALNMYRASFVHHSSFQYAEAFYKCTVEEFDELMLYTIDLDLSISS